MRLTTRQNGIISYAGLDEKALWAGAKRAFIQADGPVPRRFRAFLPLFPAELIQNMSYAGPGARRANAAGFPSTPGNITVSSEPNAPPCTRGTTMPATLTRKASFMAAAR